MKKQLMTFEERQRQLKREVRFIIGGYVFGMCIVVAAIVYLLGEYYIK